MKTFTVNNVIEEESGEGFTSAELTMLKQFCADAGIEVDAQTAVTQVKPKSRMQQLMELAMKRPEPTFREKPIDERREYMKRKQQEYRDRKAAAKADGKKVAQTPEIRNALADAALALLATDGPGSDQIRTFLFNQFPGMAGLPFTITVKAKQGKLKSK